jgi:hypothetical protein
MRIRSSRQARGLIFSAPQNRFKAQRLSAAIF